MRSFEILSILKVNIFVLFSCVVFVTFLCGVLGHVVFDVSIPDPCRLTYLNGLRVIVCWLAGRQFSIQAH